MSLETRDTQTQVKHLILAGYMTKWWSIIISGLAGPARRAAARGQVFQARFVYVDGFGYKGRYAGNTSEVLLHGASTLPTWGSPIIGVQSLDQAKEHARVKGFTLSTWAFVAEDEAKDYQDLIESLNDAGFASRVLRNVPTVAFRDGMITVCKGDFLTRVEPLMSVLLHTYTYALVLLDPFGPKGIPYDVVRQFVTLPSADVIINFPYQDLHKKLNLVSKKERTTWEEAVLSNYDAMFGTQGWREVVTKWTAHAPLDKCRQQVEADLATFYEQRLRQADHTVAVKSMRLAFPDQDRTMFYLFLTTHDPTGALAMNEVIYEARVSEYALKWDYGQATWIHKQHQAKQLTIFDTPMGTLEAPTPPDGQVDIPALAAEIQRHYRGESVSMRDVLVALVDTDYYLADIERALRYLKKNGRIQFSDLRIKDTLYFAGA